MVSGYSIVHLTACNDFPCLENKEKNRTNLESLSIILCLIYLCPKPPLTACDVPCLSAPRKLFCCSCPIIWFIELMFVPLTKPYPLPIELFQYLCTDLVAGLLWVFRTCVHNDDLYSAISFTAMFVKPHHVHRHYRWTNPYYSYSYFYISFSQFNHLEQVRIPAVSKAIKDNMFDLLCNKVIACLSSMFFVILMLNQGEISVKNDLRRHSESGKSSYSNVYVWKTKRPITFLDSWNVEF